jgi:hypothetical protein
MLNPALAAMMTGERIAELQRADTRRSTRPRSSGPVAVTSSSRPPVSVRPPRLANRQQAIGWFLVSVGLRLALPRAGAGSAR